MDRIKIKHAGPRGWAGVVPSAFDPDRHEKYDEKGFKKDDMLAKAKAMGIKGAHLMRPETLAQRIAEAENGADG